MHKRWILYPAMIFALASAPSLAGTFATYDSNGDGKLSKEEARGVHTDVESFSRLDRNGDGKLDQDEFREMGEDRDFATWDSDADGYVSADEMNDGYFMSYDTNRDGVWEEREWDEFAAASLGRDDAASELDRGVEGTTAQPGVSDEDVSEAGITVGGHSNVISGPEVKGVNAPHPLFTEEEQAEIAKRAPIEDPDPKMQRKKIQSTFYFELDSFELTESAKQKAQELAERIQNVSAAKIVIDGHTDTTGTEPYNKELADARAQAIKDALVDQGVMEQRIITHAFGETDPAVPTGDDVRLAKNRRVKVKVVQ